MRRPGVEGSIMIADEVVCAGMAIGTEANKSPISRKAHRKPQREKRETAVSKAVKKSMLFHGTRHAGYSREEKQKLWTQSPEAQRETKTSSFFVHSVHVPIVPTVSIPSIPTPPSLILLDKETTPGIPFVFDTSHDVDIDCA